MQAREAPHGHGSQSTIGLPRGLNSIPATRNRRSNCCVNRPGCRYSQADAQQQRARLRWVSILFGFVLLGISGGLADPGLARAAPFPSALAGVNGLTSLYNHTHFFRAPGQFRRASPPSIHAAEPWSWPISTISSWSMIASVTWWANEVLRHNRTRPARRVFSRLPDRPGRGVKSSASACSATSPGPGNRADQCVAPSSGRRSQAAPTDPPRSP